MTTAVIGGSGFCEWDQLKNTETLEISTPFAPEPVCVNKGILSGCEIVFIPRHGRGHTIPPHRINYRANIHALRELEASRVIAIAAVGGISPGAEPGVLVVPDQILDYTYGREHTFFDGGSGVVGHVDMTEPYSELLRQRLIDASTGGDPPVLDRGTYAVTQGPRFETAAEVRRLERDGADIVGMTGMPEASLAREAGLAYATVAVVVNPAAGKSPDAISMDEVRRLLESARLRVGELVTRVVSRIRGDVFTVPPPMTP